MALVFGLAVGVYANTFGNSFTQDDHYLIETNEALKNPSSILEIVMTDFFSRSKDTSAIGYFRPLTRLTWFLDYQIYGLHPTGFHITNVLLHAVTSVLVFVLLVLMRVTDLPAFLGALVFAAHPSHAEAVNIITARSDVLAALFVLLALICYFKARRIDAGNRRLWIASGAAAALMACGSKESGLSVFPALILVEFVGRRAGWFPALRFSRLVWHLAPYAVGLVTYVSIRAVVLSGVGHSNDLAAHGVWTYFYGLPVGIVHYLSNLFSPVHSSTAYTVLLRQAVDADWFIAVAVLAVIFVAAFWAVRSGESMPLVALALFLLSLAPALVFHKIHVPKPLDALPLADRWLYLPSLGVPILVAWLVGISRKRVGLLVRGAVMSLLAVFSALTWQRGPVFASDFAIMREVAEYRVARGVDSIHPGQRGFVVVAEGLRALEANDLDTAEEIFSGLLRNDPQNVIVLNNLASVFLKKGRNVEAERLASRAVAGTRRLGRDRDRLLMTHGIALDRLGRFGDAALAYREVLEMNRDHADATLGYAAMLVKTGRTDEARAILEKAVQLNPRDQRLRFNLGSLCSSDCACATSAFAAYEALTRDTAEHPRRVHAREAIARCRGGAGFDTKPAAR